MIDHAYHETVKNDEPYTLMKLAKGSHPLTLRFTSSKRTAWVKWHGTFTSAYAVQSGLVSMFDATVQFAEGMHEQMKAPIKHHRRPSIA